MTGFEGPSAGAAPATPSGPLELWGGLECTVARVGDRWRDQLRETGHRDRPDDLERIAELGIRTLRQPVLWETVTPALGAEPDWRFADERLARLATLGIRPIVGLIHHGSGPAGTDLLDPAFPRLLAEHAAAVARRYPWVTDWTPVNEPLTTARFSALYGHWYPHARSERDFLTALVRQCHATALAMRAIRRVNPRARLVQTDDLGRVFSAPELSYQADYENERRWLSFDLLSGRVGPHHPFHEVLRGHGVDERDLDLLREGDAAPDVLGINHYLTSDRFLDERLHLYPPHLAGGNAFTRYADVEAVRTDLPPAWLGPAARLREAWERYGKPIAVTEVHHGCTRDEQLRWLAEVWRGAETVRREGADVRAVTLWSLFGTVDWNSLLVWDRGIYEPGAFDVRGPSPRPTALARAARDLATRGRFDHPVLDVPGWWRRADHRYGRVPGDERLRREPRTVLIVGPDGPVRRAFARLATFRGLACRYARSTGGGGREGLDGVWAVLDLSGAEPGLSAARRARFAADAEALAARCGRDGLSFLSLASEPAGDDGAPPATESALPPNEREARLQATVPDALLLRAGPIFGPWDADDVVAPLLAALAAGRPCQPPPGLVSPTYAPDLVHVALDLLIDGETGLRHLANGEAATGAELAGRLADGLGRSRLLVRAPRGAARGRALATERGSLMPPLESALARFLRDRAFAVASDDLAVAAE